MLRKSSPRRTRGPLGAAFSPAAPWRAGVAETTEAPLKDVHWSFEGPFGDVRPGAASARLQGLSRGLLRLPLDEHGRVPQSRRSGRPVLEPQVPEPQRQPGGEGVAKDDQIADIDADTGDTIKRPGTTADYFPPPFANAPPPAPQRRSRCRPTCRCWRPLARAAPAYIYSVVTGDGTTPPPGLTDSDRQVLRPRVCRATSSSY